MEMFTAHYYSGRYKQYGVNIQACCYHLSPSTFITVVGPGEINDNQAIHKVDICSLIAKMIPRNYCIIGDAE
jgi:hypothetical protein